MIKVYPNPTKGAITIETETLAILDQVHVKITDLWGREMIKFVVPGGHQKQQVNTEPWSSGIYLYVLEINGERKGCGKFLISK